MSAKAASESAVKAKLDELAQGQLAQVLHERIERYPSLWKLCQGGISVLDLTGTLPPEGWDKEFSQALEGWHAEHGVFLSEDSYRGIWHLRQRARYFAARSTAGASALGNLNELNKIWTRGFIDSDGTVIGGVSTLLKNDLGSYGRAAMSISVR
jgi:hypothetical protein